MKALTRTPDPRPDPVCEFYTRHPCPPPVENLDRARDEWRDPNRAPSTRLRPQAVPGDLDILIAGCGTWQAAKCALWGDASWASTSARPAWNTLAGSLRNTTSPISRPTSFQWKRSKLSDQFDLIVCTGVLHHLEDPDAGLCALRSVLKPGAPSI